MHGACGMLSTGALTRLAPVPTGESWQALTCGRIPTDTDLQCFTTPGGSYVCPCPHSYCNNHGWRDAAGSAALVSALLGLALAAGW